MPDAEPAGHDPGGRDDLGGHDLGGHDSGGHGLGDGRAGDPGGGPGGDQRVGAFGVASEEERTGSAAEETAVPADDLIEGER